MKVFGDAFPRVRQKFSVLQIRRRLFPEPGILDAGLGEQGINDACRYRPIPFAIHFIQQPKKPVALLFRPRFQKLAERLHPIQGITPAV